MRFSGLVCVGFGLILLTACEGFRPVETERDPLARTIREQGSIFGDSLEIGGDGPGAGGTTGLAVNGYLWRASLDTIAFFPMAQVDAHGGVILTEWYSLPEAPNERYKIQVYILNRELRADGVRVSLFKQAVTASGQWVDTPVAEGSASKIENAILTRARQLRIDSQAILE